MIPISPDEIFENMLQLMRLRVHVYIGGSVACPPENFFLNGAIW